MATDGWNLVLVARREELLKKLVDSLSPPVSGGEPKGGRFTILPTDLSHPAAAVEIVRQLDERGIALDALINNAGFGLYGMFAGQEWEPLERMIAVNITALTKLTHLIVPGMVERGHGMVMNVASTAAFQAVPTSAVYAATKAFVLSFSEALATELQATGVTVTALCPGVTATGFQRVAGAEHLEEDFRGAMTVSEGARLGYRAMLRGKRVEVTGGMNAFLAFATRLSPRSLAAEIAFRMMRKRHV